MSPGSGSRSTWDQEKVNRRRDVVIRQVVTGGMELYDAT